MALKENATDVQIGVKNVSLIKYVMSAKKIHILMMEIVIV